MKKESEEAQNGQRKSVVYRDRDGNILWEEGVLYNEGGALVVPLPVTVEEWDEVVEEYMQGK